MENKLNQKKTVTAVNQTTCQKLLVVDGMALLSKGFKSKVYKK